MATLNVARLKVQLAKDQRGKIKAAATRRATQIFDQAVNQLREDFDEHKVTREIEGGIQAENISETLRGGEAPENLYSFIGFHAGDRPTEEIRRRLSPKHRDGPKIKYEGKDEQRTTWRFRVTAPDREGIYDATPMPWAKGLSWAQKIETGIQGFQSFLAKFGLTSSRSGGGVQATVGGKKGGSPQVLREATYVPPAEGYLNTLFNRFIERIKEATKLGGRGRDAGGRFTPFQ